MTPGEQVTPTGVFVSDADPETDEWFAARRSGITATDIPKILDLSRYGNALSVWLDKRGEPLDDELGEAGEWGVILEDVVAQRWANRNGYALTRAPVIRNADTPWAVASLDRLVKGCDRGHPEYGCPLEVKTRSAFVAGKWREDVPDDVLAQVTWQLFVSGYDHSHVAVLFGGQRAAEHTVERDEGLEAYVLAQAERVWECVQGGVQPEVDPTVYLAKLLDAVHPNREGTVDLSEQRLAALNAIDRYETARLQIKALDEEQAIAKAELVQLLGAANTAVVDGAPVFTYKPQARTSTDVKRLQSEFPAAHKACVTTKPTAPVLRIAGAYQHKES